MKNVRHIMAFVLVLVLDVPASARWSGVEPWQDVKMGASDTFLHIIVGNAVGALVQTKFQGEDRRSQFIKALTISVAIGLVKEIADMSLQYKQNSQLFLPDSVKDMAMNLLGVFMSFNFDIGPSKGQNGRTLPLASEESRVSLNGTPESVSLSPRMAKGYDFTLLKIP